MTAEANTNVTFPTTGTLATLAGTEALTNKTITAMAAAMNMADQDIEGSALANGDLTLKATSHGTVLSAFVISSHLHDASADGVATKVVAGAIGDGSFVVTAPPDGTIGIDSTNGRIYFRYGAAWHFASQDAGIQIPVEEVGDMAVGDRIECIVDGVMSDGALHAHWRKAA